MPQSQGHGNGCGPRSQAEQKFSRSGRDSCGEAKSAQRAGGMPGAAAAPGSATVTFSGAGWQILKGRKLKTKKNPNTKDPTEKQPSFD